MPDPFTVELREFIRRLNLEDSKLTLMRRQTYALRQGIRNLATDVRSGGGVCLTTITGKIIGCDTAQAPLPSSVLRIVGHTTGTAYGTFTVTSGTFALDLALNSSDTSLDLYATGPGVRFVESAAQLKAVTLCASNAVGAITTTPATGYHCATEFAFPLADTLNLVDPVFGNRTATWAASDVVFSPAIPLWKTPTANVTTLTSTTCASAVTPLTYVFISNRTNFGVDWFYRAASTAFPSCPNTVGPADSSVSSLVAWRAGTAPGAAVKMDYTWTYPAASGAAFRFYGDISGTVRIYEP